MNGQVRAARQVARWTKRPGFTLRTADPLAVEDFDVFVFTTTWAAVSPTQQCAHRGGDPRRPVCPATTAGRIRPGLWKHAACRRLVTLWPDIWSFGPRWSPARSSARYLRLRLTRSSSPRTARPMTSAPPTRARSTSGRRLLAADLDPWEMLHGLLHAAGASPAQDPCLRVDGVNGQVPGLGAAVPGDAGAGVRGEVADRTTPARATWPPLPRGGVGGHAAHYRHRIVGEALSCGTALLAAAATSSPVDL